MKIGIIGPSKVRDKEKISEVVKIVAKSGNEIVLTPDKDSSSEYFAQEYIKFGGNKVSVVVPLDDKEFGYGWVNLDLGENINCGTWRNQPEKLNEETDVLICIGYAAGVLAEIAYTKWFNKKSVLIIEELISGKLPEEIKLDLKYLSIEDLKGELENEK